MAKNDTLLLDGIIDERVEQEYPSNKRDECFEYLSFEQILKNEDLSYEEIFSGIVDGRGDGGIDGFYIFVNGHFLNDLDDFFWPKSNAELRLVIVTCKHHDTFKKATLDSMIATFTEFFDLTIANESLMGEYNSSLLNIRSNLIFSIKKISPKLKELKIEVFYSSRGDADNIGEEIISRANQVEKILNDNFSNGEIVFNFFGSKELLNLFRKERNYTLELPFKEILSRDERYVILANLKDYYNFISESGVLKKHIFDANVRSFMGLNNVNEDIKITLEAGKDDFWLLNNGVTILVTSASIIGKSLQAADVQIVNGLQTSQSIFNHFHAGSSKGNDDRCLLVKVIVTNNGELRDRVIKATNNQTTVESSSLHATDKIQRDIEDILLQNGLYYERRKNYYLNQGVDFSDLFSLQYMASAYLALVLKSPMKAISLKSKTLRDESKYNIIFNSNFNLKIWPKLAVIFRKVDHFLIKSKPKVRDRFLKKWRYIVAFLFLSKYFKKFDFNALDIIDFNIDDLNGEAIIDIYNEIKDFLPSANLLVTEQQYINICFKFSENYKIDALEMVLRANPFNQPDFQPFVYRDSPTPKRSASFVKEKVYKKESPKKILLEDEFLDEILKVIPNQPWKPNAINEVLPIIGCSKRKLKLAIVELIKRGRLFEQRNGVLYDLSGNVVAIDESRVDINTLQLKENPL